MTEFQYKIKAREVEINDVDGYLDPLGHNVCLKIIPECQDVGGREILREEYENGRVVYLVICERGWCEEDHAPVPVTKHELGEIIREFKLLYDEMNEYPLDIRGECNA